MLQSEPELMMISEYIRLQGATYVIGRRKIEDWKKKFVELVKKTKGMDKKSKEYRNFYQEKNRLLKEIEEYYDSEEFFFGDEIGNIDDFFEKYKLNLLGWDVEYFKRMIKDGNVLIKRRSKKDANHEREESEESGLLDDNDGSRGMFGGRFKGRTSGIGSGNSATVIRRATALAGCVC